MYMLPTLDPATGYLPPGVHTATWAEIAGSFSTNSHRARQLVGLLSALKNLTAAGCSSFFLDGSFVSQKPLPGDYDAAWNPIGVDPNVLDPVLLDFTNHRAAMKAKYGGEFFPASWPAAPGIMFIDFFQRDRNGVSKGIISIDLGSLP
ncbi:MAG: hypothetical protein J0H86_00110 [Xanthomonadaceae bacterium]|nr:hypothetical protein [Xanthomonadaceae bacterium]